MIQRSLELYNFNKNKELAAFEIKCERNVIEDTRQIYNRTTIGFYDNTKTNRRTPRIHEDNQNLLQKNIIFIIVCLYRVYYLFT